VKRETPEANTGGLQMKKTNKLILGLAGISFGIAGIGVGATLIGKPVKADATDGLTATFDFTAAGAASGIPVADLATNGYLEVGNLKMTCDPHTTSAIGYNTTSSVWYSNPARIYKNAVLAFSGFDTSTASTVTTVSSITSAVFTCGSTAYATALNTSTWSGATAAVSSSTVTATPTGSSFSVTLGAQVRISKIVVTYNTTVTNVDPVESISLNATSGTVAAGLSTTITPTVLPSTANQNVTAASANTTIATVSVNSDHTVKVTGVAAGSTTITVTTVGVNSSSATLSATYDLVVRAFTWSDLRPSYVFDTTLANATITLEGVVTKLIAGTSFALQSGDQAIYGFSYSAVANIAVGNYVSVQGTVSSYNGLIELANPVATVLTGTAPATTTTTVTESMITNYANVPSASAPGLTGLDSTLVSVSGIKLAAALTATAATATSGTANVGAASIAIYSNKSDVTTSNVDAFNTFFNKVGAVADDIVFNGVLGWSSNTPQLDLTAASELSSAEVTAVDNFVTTYVNITEGDCATRWTNAKAAYAGLTDVEKSMFNTCTGYSDMHARYQQWALANGETAAVGNFGINNETDTTSIALIAASFIVIIGAAGFMMIRRKKQA
jgi:uncharacterized protein YjdB